MLAQHPEPLILDWAGGGVRGGGGIVFGRVNGGFPNRLVHWPEHLRICRFRWTLLKQLPSL